MFTVKTAATRMGVKSGLVYRLLKRGEIAHSRVGLGRGVIRIEEAAVEEYLGRKRAKPEPRPVIVEQRTRRPAVPVLKHLNLN